MFSLKMIKKKERATSRMSVITSQIGCIVPEILICSVSYEKKDKVKKQKKAFAKQPAVIKLTAPSRDYSSRKCCTRPFSPDALVWAHIKGNLHTGFHSTASNCDLYFISQMLRSAAERLFIRRCSQFTPCPWDYFEKSLPFRRHRNAAREKQIQWCRDIFSVA